MIGLCVFRERIFFLFYTDEFYQQLNRFDNQKIEIMMTWLNFILIMTYYYQNKQYLIII